MEVRMRFYKILIPMLSIFLLNTVAYADRMSTPANERELLPSTPPGPDCNWDNYQSQELGIRMLVQNCPKSLKSYQFFTRDNTIVAKEIIKNTGITKEYIIIQMYHKLPDLTIRDAIRQQFINRLSGEALTNCQVKRVTDKLVLLSEQVTLEISPTGDYALKIDEEIKANPSQLAKIVTKYKLKLEKNREFPRVFYINFQGRQIPYQNKFLDDLFGMKIGQVTDAFPSGSLEIMIGILREIKKPTTNSNQVKALKQKAEEDFRSEILQEFNAYLLKENPVTVNEKLLGKKEEAAK